MVPVPPQHRHYPLGHPHPHNPAVKRYGTVCLWQNCNPGRRIVVKGKDYLDHCMPGTWHKTMANIPRFLSAPCSSCARHESLRNEPAIELERTYKEVLRSVTEDILSPTSAPALAVESHRAALTTLQTKGTRRSLQGYFTPSDVSCSFSPLSFSLLNTVSDHHHGFNVRHEHRHRCHCANV